MKAAAIISVLLVLVCATARTANAGPGTDIPRVTAELTDYWQATLGARVQSYEGPHTIVYYQSPIETPCGPSTMHNARFCPGDDTIYLDETWVDELLAADDYTPVAIIAHEWGHEVQNELGTLDRSSEHAYLRALELQADCFAGLFVRSQLDNGRIGSVAVAAARRFFFSVGDPSPKTRSHGTGAQRVRWFNTAYRSGSFDVCESVIRKEHAMPRIPEE
jgi:uncharacterized protein